MNFEKLTYNDCCLLSNICLNAQRISYLLECRFKRNSIRTSFDFKSIRPEQLSNDAKVSRTFLKFHPKKFNSIDNDNESVSAESSDDEIDDFVSPKLTMNIVDDDYLNELAEWEPNQFQPFIESNEEENEIRNDIENIDHENKRTDSMDISTGMWPITCGIELHGQNYCKFA